MDQILTDENMLGKAREYNIEKHHIFTEFQSACDGVQRDK